MYLFTGSKLSRLSCEHEFSDQQGFEIKFTVRNKIIQNAIFHPYFFVRYQIFTTILVFLGSPWACRFKIVGLKIVQFFYDSLSQLLPAKSEKNSSSEGLVNLKTERAPECTIRFASNNYSTTNHLQIIHSPRHKHTNNKLALLHS